MGRLFDAVAALAGLKQRCSFEGQAAMLLEFAARGQITDECYPFEITPVTVCDGGCGRMIEWKPMIAAILEDEDPAMIAAKFHNTLAALIVEAAEQAGLAAGERVVALSGGCFQNRELLGRAVRRLREAGFRAYWQQTTPPNDGGIAVGQIAAAARTLKHVSGSTGKADQHQR
jgi:hydrogenase maturation protein HypF